MGRRISKEFLHPSILEGVNDKIGNLDSLETDAKGNMVQAINELVEKLDNSAEIENGKELIANAVGEPLTAEESFDEMSNDINGLLSTFKTNMMNNGITVESSDRFKSLIDKIATMVEEGSGKGIQYASGNGVISYRNLRDNGFPVNIDFIPTLLFVDFVGVYDNTCCNVMTGDCLAHIGGCGSATRINFILKYENGYVKTVSADINTTYNNIDSTTEYTWYAIGVGEEDTTLRDSLASILEEEGVNITEEDDMASLITKVDEEFDRKNANAVSLISGTSYTLLNSSELHVYEEMINKEVLYTHNYPGGVIKFSTLISNMGRTDSDGWYTAYDRTYLVVNHIRNGETISSVTYRHKIEYGQGGENEVAQSVNYIVENGDKLQFLGNAPQGVSYCIEYIKLTADIQW